MEIYYGRTPVPNFGDDLNKVLWEKILPPEVLNAEISEKLCGIGTILNHKMPLGHYFVLGSGAGYGDPPESVSLTVFSLRGPLTANEIGVSSDLVATDSAILIRKIWPELLTIKVRYKYGYIPHWEQHILHGNTLRHCCRLVGVKYISPCQAPHDVAVQISECRVNLAEAMHGAIFSDNLRREWIPIVLSTNINSFKWKDWCASVNIEYAPNRLFNPCTLLNFSNPVRLLLSISVCLQLLFISRFSRRYLSDEKTLKKNQAKIDQSLKNLVDTVVSIIRKK